MIRRIPKSKRKNVNPILGDVKKVIENKYDTVIANINKNILIDSMEDYLKITKKGGDLFLSGFYKGDKKDIIESAEKNGFCYESEKEDKNWIAIKLKK